MEWGRPTTGRGGVGLAGLALLWAVLAGCPESAQRVEPGGDAPSPAPPPLAHVGGEACAGCHPAEAEAWRGSHHDLAMAEPGPETVRGDFEGARFVQGASSTEFTHRDGRYFVTTEGPDGERAEFEVAYVFGWDPLQQYLLRLPGGRLQALGVAWDSRPPEQGGGRWYSLYPDETLLPGDPLHWTGLQQNWNHMCAECHSTGVRKGYDAEADRFDTRFEEVDVSCEACHGPGSRHVAWAREAEPGSRPPDAARTPVAFGSAATWRFREGEGIATRDPPAAGHAEVEACGRCHARRALLAEEVPVGQPLSDTHRVALLEDGLYFPDGQIRDEVYVYGSFLQSRMYAAGVTCRDCHDPHSLALTRGAEPDAVCSGCHAPAVYATPEHHHHAAGSPGASCVACHMPERTYMGVDPRRDHSFRRPRPALAAELGAGDPCTSCHVGTDAAWAEAALREFGVAPGGSHFGLALRDARAARPGAADELLVLASDAKQPAIVRATALQELGRLGRSAPEVVRAAASDPDPLVRFGAAEAGRALPPPLRVPALRGLLSDPVRSVRLAAEEVLRDVDPALFAPRDRSVEARVQEEFRAVQRLHGDRPESWSNLGALLVAHGDAEAALAAYRRALRLAPDAVPVLVNLADLHRAMGKDDEAEAPLLRAAELAPESGDVQYALGLLRVRQGRMDEAERALARAARLAPAEPRYALVHALALEKTRGPRAADALLAQAVERFPDDRELRFLSATRARDRGDREEALRHARALLALAPEDEAARGLLASLEADGP